MDKPIVINVENVTKNFKLYTDKGKMLKERLLFQKRNSYELRKVLKGISFQVRKGESIGLIGSNGCGKSTTLKLLSKIIYPNSGTIRINGRVSSLIELGAGFHPDMSGRENIFINAAIFGLSKKETEKRLSNIIAFSELEEFIDNPVRTYSSGMYMRLAFAVAINVDADILLIDEILAVGDTNFQAKCFNRLNEIKASGVTIIMVSHDSNTIERFCDRAIWLDNGHIVKQGNTVAVVDAYMHHMGEKRLLNLRHEEQKTVETENPNIDPIPLCPSEAEEDTVASDSDTTANRFGMRYIEITKANLIGEQGIPTTILQNGEDITIEIYYKVHRHQELVSMI